jgi:hypothetical protein
MARAEVRGSAPTIYLVQGVPLHWRSRWDNIVRGTVNTWRQAGSLAETLIFRQGPARAAARDGRVRCGNWKAGDGCGAGQALYSKDLRAAQRSLGRSAAATILGWRQRRARWRGKAVGGHSPAAASDRAAVALKVHLVTAARRSLGSRSRMGQWPCAMASVEGGVAGKRVRSERRGERRAQRGRLGGTGGVECARWATGAAL